MSFWDADLLIFCPELFKTTRTGKFNFKNAPWSIDQIQPSADVKKPTHIDTIASTIALTWLHELGHLINNCTCSSPSHSESHPNLSSDHDPKAISGAKSKSGRVSLVYGWDEIVLYAQQQPNEAHKCPDSLAYFGAAMYWQEFYWASGTAKTVPEGATASGSGAGASAPKSKRGSRVMRKEVEGEVRSQPSGESGGMDSG